MSKKNSAHLSEKLFKILKMQSLKIPTDRMVSTAAGAGCSRWRGRHKATVRRPDHDSDHLRGGRRRRGTISNFSDKSKFFKKMKINRIKINAFRLSDSNPDPQSANKNSHWLP